MDMDSFMDPLRKQIRNLSDWLTPTPTTSEPVNLETARYLMDHDRFGELLPYRGFDRERNLMMLDDGKSVSAGFMLAMNPLLIAGLDAEPQLEAVINACPPETTLQFSVLSGPQVGAFLDRWTTARIEKTTNPLLRDIALARRRFFEEAALGRFSLLPKEQLYPRLLHYFVSVRIPYKGALSSEEDMATFLKTVQDTRDTIQGALSGAMIGTTQLDELGTSIVLRELLNPQLKPRSRIQDRMPDAPILDDLIDRDNRIRVTKEGYLAFSGNDPAIPETWMAAITADHLPSEAYLPMMAELIGDPMSREDRISVPFFAYTVVNVLDPDAARDRLTTKMGALNKQTMSESPWYRSMMGHLFEQRDAVSSLLQQASSGHALVRAYSGINLYATEKTVKRSVEYVKGLWRRKGFRASAERFITLPAFIASLPMAYSASMDPPGKGLQRATTMHSANAASLAFVQGDWAGNSPSLGGPLLISRRGQLATFNLLESSTNYNFIVVAASGSGKSFFTNDIIADFLAQNGLVRVIDVGRSYWRTCERLGGQNLVFDPRFPVSLNPFTGLATREDLNEMLPILKTMLRQMAWPLQPEDATPAWEYQAIELALTAAWESKGDKAELADAYNWLLEHGDERAQDLAFQLAPYAVGRHKPWFTGPRGVSFDKPLAVIELEELKADPEMQAVVLTLLIAQITKEIYLSDRAQRKALIIDEAWDLLGNVKTGKFIETAFRRVRKYNGIAGVITQSFEDFERSAAGKAAIENAEWKFVLHQNPESLEYALANKRVVGDAYLLSLLKTVKSGDGFSEVYVRSGNGQGVYRFVTDRHSYYLYTTNPKDIARLEALTASGLTLSQAIDKLAREDYINKWGWTMPPMESIGDAA
ncbi:MAG: TraC family protein [Candidatus Nanopelagicales bacterium]